jgi:Tol biopolymer transport system component
VLALLVPAAADAAFPGATNGRIAFTTFGSGADVFSIVPDGSDPRNVTNTAAPLVEERPSYSPNGRLIAYSRQDGGATMTDLFLMNADGSGQRPLSAPAPEAQEAPAFSPDGSMIAFAGYATDRVDIWVVRADGTGALNLTNHPAGVFPYAPTFSPDGRQVVYDSCVSGSCDLWAVPVGGGTPVNLTNTPSPVQESNADFSPDGRSIVYERSAGMGLDLAIMNPDGSGQRPITATPGNNEFAPAFSPDGSRIALRQGSLDDIVTIAPDGTDPRNVTTNGNAVTEFNPTWEAIYTCAGRRATIVGDDGPDRIRGTKGADVIVANAGKDKIAGRGGSDRICAGKGKDKVAGNAGKKDRCFGGGGKDKGGKGCEKGKL